MGFVLGLGLVLMVCGLFVFVLFFYAALGCWC